MRPTERLLARLRAETDLDLPESTRIVRTYAGSAQRSAGAWSWYLVSNGGELYIGSYHTVTELLRAPELDVTS